MEIAVLRPIFYFIKSPLFVFSSNLLSHMRRFCHLCKSAVFQSSILLIYSTGPLNFHHWKEKHQASHPKVYRGEEIKRTSLSAWLEVIFLFRGGQPSRSWLMSWHPQISFCNCPVGKVSLYPQPVDAPPVQSAAGNCWFTAKAHLPTLQLYVCKHNRQVDIKRLLQCSWFLTFASRARVLNRPLPLSLNLYRDVYKVARGCRGDRSYLSGDLS